MGSGFFDDFFYILMLGEFRMQRGVLSAFFGGYWFPWKALLGSLLKGHIWKEVFISVVCLLEEEYSFEV